MPFLGVVSSTETKETKVDLEDKMPTKNNSNRKIPKDLISFPQFLRENNIPVSRATACRLRRDPNCPAGYQLRPSLVLYSASELENFIEDKRFENFPDMQKR